MIIEYTPWNIPFLSKADGKNIKRKDIYCRKNSSTTKVDYEDLKKILDIRIDDGMNNNKNTFDEDIDQIETLYLYFERYKYLKKDYYDAFDERKQYINELATRKKDEYKKSVDINRISYVEYSKEIDDIEVNVEWNTLEEQVNIFNKHLGRYGVQITFVKPKV